MEIIIYIVLFCIAIALISVLFMTFVEYNEAKRIRNKFYMFGRKDNLTRFNYSGNEVEIYVDINYLFDPVKGYNSDLYIETLYINNIPVISVSCFDRTFHKSMSWNFNGEYSYKEIMRIIRCAKKEYNKKMENKVRKSIFDKECKNA